MLVKSWQQSVIRSLVYDYGWDSPNAHNWAKTHVEYMTAMCESAAPPEQTAEYIHNMVSQESE